jgi:hypothetical protein
MGVQDEGLGFTVEQRLNMPSTSAALDSPLAYAEGSGFGV